MPKLRTQPSTPRLSEVARHVVVPSGVVTTGWSAVEAKCADLGVSFRWWQKPIGQIVLGKRSDGTYAASIGGVGLSIARQVGKTFLVGAILFALSLLRPGLTVIWTAHRLRTADETFGKMLAFSRRKRIAPHMLRPVLGSGEEEIRFRNGSRILFGARERGFGRGFAEVDVVVYDEAQILSDSALDDMIPAMNQSRQPEGALLLFIGTPPKPENPSEVFTRMRTEALSGEDADTAWIEFGADPGYVPPRYPEPLTAADWRQMAKANPSFPDDTPREAILRMRKQLGHDSFLREGLGIWDQVTRSEWPVVPRALWDALEPRPGDPGETRTLPALDVPPSALGVHMSLQRSVVISGVWDMGERWHGEVLSLAQLDTTTAVEWLRARAGRRIPVVVDGFAAAGAMIPALKNAGLRVITTNAVDMGKACGNWFDMANEGRFTHSGQAPLSEAVRFASRRVVGKQGAWAFAESDPDHDVSPLVSVVLALFGANVTRKKSGSGRSNGNRVGVVL